MALLEVDGVSKRFGGVAANTDISFTVEEGEILGLIGPNGAGKTSLFNSIAGEVVPDAGAIRLGGRAISGAGPVACARAGVGRTFQVVRSFETMTVVENTMVGAFLRHGSAGSPISPAGWRASCRRHRSGAWKWHGRWQPNRGCCCSMRC
jgi:branched-chain amino acid transport system ATP-binding protein